MRRRSRAILSSLAPTAIPSGVTRVTVAAAVAAAFLSVLPAADPATGASPGPISENATAVATPGGAPGLILYAGPVQLRRGTGWVPIDLTLHAGPDGVVRPAAAPLDLALTTTGPRVRFANGGGTELAWPSTLPAPALAGSRATYPQAAPGYDLVVDATSAGFMASLRRAGAVPGAPVPPLALRGNTEGVGDSAVDYVVAAAPVAGTAPVPFDTTVQTTIPTADMSGHPDLRLGTYDGGTSVARSFISFDATPLARRPVARATLSVFQSWSASCQPRTWEVWSAAAAGPGTRWGNQPALTRLRATSTDTRGHDAACGAGWSTVDVTDMVRDWSQSGTTIGSLALRAGDEADVLAWKRFGAAESATVPHLDVTFG